MKKREINKCLKAMQSVDKDNDYCCTALKYPLDKKFLLFLGKNPTHYWVNSLYGPINEKNKNIRLTALAFFMIASKDVIGE